MIVISEATLFGLWFFPQLHIKVNGQRSSTLSWQRGKVALNNERSQTLMRYVEMVESVDVCVSLQMITKGMITNSQWSNVIAPCHEFQALQITIKS